MTYFECLKQSEEKLSLLGLDSYVARFLLADVLGIQVQELFTEFNSKIDNQKIELYESYIDKYIEGHNPEYIINKTYFYGNELYVDDRVLIPRKETEELVELFLKNNNEKKLKVLDLCCGSGCIGLTIKKERPDILVYLSDINKRCLDVVEINKRKLNVDAILLKGDLFQPIRKLDIDIDIVVCNPPYIAKNDPNINKYTFEEPPDALFTSDSLGLEFYKRIFDYLSRHKFKKAYFEFGFNQKKDLEELLKKYNFKYYFYKDMSSYDRMLEIIK